MLKNVKKNENGDILKKFWGRIKIDSHHSLNTSL